MEEESLPQNLQGIRKDGLKRKKKEDRRKAARKRRAAGNGAGDKLAARQGRDTAGEERPG